MKFKIWYVDREMLELLPRKYQWIMELIGRTLFVIGLCVGAIFVLSMLYMICAEAQKPGR